MGARELHDLLVELKNHANSLSLEDVDRKQHLNEIIESLEEQVLDASGVENHAEIAELVEDKLLHFEVEHPKITAVLSSIINTLKSIGV